jgi:hypothetical protein
MRFRYGRQSTEKTNPCKLAVSDQMLTLLPIAKAMTAQDLSLTFTECHLKKAQKQKVLSVLRAPASFSKRECFELSSLKFHV